MPLDLIVVPLREKGKITGIGVHAGLWTSQALTVPIEEVPVLRRQLAELEKEFGFEPSGHSGKALRHALASLPRDLLVNLRPEAVKELVATAISLADRPRPTLLLVRSILKGHMFAFVWLPRDELTTRRRVAIGEMIEQAAEGQITNWSVDLGDGDLALVRYTLNVDAKRPTPDVKALDQQARRDGARLGAERRGGAGRARSARRARPGSRSPISTNSPKAIAIRTGAEDAAQDVVCLSGLEDAGARDVRLFRRDDDADDRLHLKIYRVGGIIPLVRSGAGVREFRLPRARRGADPGRPRPARPAMSTISTCRCRATATPRAVLKRAARGRARRSPTCSRARPRTTRSTS